MAKVEKLSLTLSKADLVWARKRAKQQGVSLSALLSEMLARRRRQEVWDDWLRQVLDTPFSVDELEAARRELDGLPPLKRPAAKRRKAG